MSAEKANEEQKALAQPILDAVNLLKHFADGADGAMMLYKAFDGIFEGDENVAEAHCMKGCSFCCHSRVECTKTEALAFKKWCDFHLNDIEKFAIVRKAKEFKKKVESLTKEQRLILRYPCPFLDNQGACGIHPARPLVCRGVYSNNRMACQVAHEEPENEEVMVPLQFIPKDLANDYSTAILIHENKDEKKGVKQLYEWILKLME